MLKEPTIWQLCKERCNCCNGQNELVFSTCPTCGLTLLACAGAGTVFEIREHRAGPVLSGSTSDVCAKCKSSAYAEYRDTTLDEILALGFRPEDIKRWVMML
jgi:hypothetical protein